MTNQGEINKQLNEEYDKFLVLPYAGKVAVPDFIIDLFKKSIMAMPPFAHKINFHKIKAIAGMRPGELTNGLLSDVVKVILNVPMEKLYPDSHFYSAVNLHIEVEKFILAFNKHIDDFRKGLETKKATLESLTKNISGNGLRIIPQA
jgi:hypothetical protein